MTDVISPSALRDRFGDNGVRSVLDTRAGSDAFEVELGPNNCAATHDAIN